MPRKILFLLLFILFLFSCQDEKKAREILLPSTPLQQAKESWGLVNGNYLRLRTEPQDEAELTGTLWKGYVIKVLIKNNQKIKIDEKSGYWYYVDHQGISGWAFGPLFKIYHSQKEAEQASQELKRE